jgi:hypothetical protein
MNNDRPTKAVRAIIQTVAQGDGGAVVEMDIAEFRSQYPTKITRVPQVDADKLSPGHQYEIVLERQNLKRDKDGQYKTGNMPYDYYYGWVGFKGDGGIVESMPSESDNFFNEPNEPRAAPTQQQGFSLDERIAWNSAVNNTVNVLGPVDVRPEAVDYDNYMEEVAEMAPRLYRLIRQGPPSELAPDDATSPVEAPQEAETQQTMQEVRREVLALITEMSVQKSWVDNAMPEVAGKSIAGWSSEELEVARDKLRDLQQTHKEKKKLIENGQESF